MGTIAGMFVAGYLVIVLLLALAQTQLLFPRWMLGSSSALPAGAAPLSLNQGSGITLRGHLLPGDAGAAERPLLLGFGGNATDAVDLALFLREVLPEYDIAVFHYRGYGKSSGRPSAAALLDDALAQFDALQTRFGERRIVAVGFSIGVGPAAWLASERDLTGVILVTPFDTLHAIARQHYPWIPINWFFRHRMDPQAALAGSEIPIALITARRDTIIPPQRAEALAQGLETIEPGVVFSAVIDAGHNDIYGRSDFHFALRAAVRATSD